MIDATNDDNRYELLSLFIFVRDKARLVDFYDAAVADAFVWCGELSGGTVKGAGEEVAEGDFPAG